LIQWEKAERDSLGDDAMRAEYDFTGGVRGKHYRTMQGGYTITITRQTVQALSKR
jgi:hypothetical protein